MKIHNSLTHTYGSIIKNEKESKYRPYRGFPSLPSIPIFPSHIYMFMYTIHTDRHVYASDTHVHI